MFNFMQYSWDQKSFARQSDSIERMNGIKFSIHSLRMSKTAKNKRQSLFMLLMFCFLADSLIRTWWVQKIGQTFILWQLRKARLMVGKYSRMLSVRRFGYDKIYSESEIFKWPQTTTMMIKMAFNWSIDKKYYLL